MITEQQIFELRKKYCHGNYYDQDLDLYWTHSQIVKEIVLKVSCNLEKDYRFETKKEILEYLRKLEPGKQWN